MFVYFTMPGMLQNPNYAGVYKLTFDGRRFYIGGTLNLRARFHKLKHNMTNGIFKNHKVKAAYDSCASVKMEIVEMVDNHDDLGERETFYIQSFWGNPDLLNRAPSAKGNTGMRLTPEQRELLRERTGTPIGKYTRSGVLIEIYGSIAEAVEKNEITGSDLRRVLAFEGRTSKGFVYRKLNVDGTPILPPIRPKDPKKPRKKRAPLSEEVKARMRAAHQKRATDDPVPLPLHTKPMIKLDKDGTELDRFDSIGALARHLNVDNANLRKMLKKGRKGYYKGYFYFPTPDANL